MNIKAARRQLGMSLSQFAALHRCSTDAVRRWEKPETATGYREPSGSAQALTEAALLWARYSYGDDVHHELNVLFGNVLTPAS